MKKVIMMILCLMFIAAFTACAQKDASTETTATGEASAETEEVSATTEETDTEEPSETTTEETEGQTEAESEDQTVIEWAIKIGEFDVVSSMIGDSVETVTQTLQKAEEDGTVIETECTGYTVTSLLGLAGVEAFETVTVVAADGYTYDLTSEVGMLDTTMIVIEQDGEVYTSPILAVDGEGENAWVKDIVELIVS
jgi:iron uptake system EfeUOB component EfeO/EfeM